MLSQDVTRYVDLHRAMGFKFRTQYILLRHFASFAEARGDRFVITNTAVDWAGQAPSPPQRHNRLATVRRFALAMQAEDPRHQAPPGEVFGRQWFKRRTPHIYTRAQISRLIRAAARLAPRDSIRPVTYSMLFALLASTGLRVSEALALDINDLTKRWAHHPTDQVQEESPDPGT